ncbi:MAG: hypothetical protein ABFS14_13295 [Gemmatimonadota bacterium]
MKPDRARVLQEGFVAGLIGYAAVVVFFAAVNLLQGRSIFFTAEILGAPLVAGAERIPGTRAEAAVLVYNGVHLLVFLLLGLLAAWLTLQTEKHPVFWYFALYIGMAGFFLSTAFVMVASMSVPDLPWILALFANLAAGGAMGFYFAKAHPRLWRTIKTMGDSDD